jgi:hypothetical protein
MFDADRLVSHQKLMPEQRDAALSRIRPSTELKELAPCDIIIEAILEDYELKASVIRELDAICGARRRSSPPTPHPFRSRRSRRHRAFRAASSACNSSIRCR